MRNQNITSLYNTKAFIFDLNGTIVDDMEYHFIAWNYLINDRLNGGLSENEVRQNMYGKNAEVLQRIFGSSRFSKAELKKLSEEKEQKYREVYFPEMKLMNGLPSFFQQALNHDIRLAVATALEIETAVQLLERLRIREYFEAVVTADDVINSKPDPETFLLAAEKLKLEAADCLVFEDSPKGAEAAQRAGMRVIALTTSKEPVDFLNQTAVDFFVSDFSDPSLRALIV